MADEKLEALRKRKVEREEAAKKAREAREMQVLELEEQMIQKLGGPRGRAFDIVDVADEPLIVVKPGAAVLLKRLRESKMTLDDLQGFVVPNVEQPDPMVFGQIVERRAGALVRCFDAVVALYRGEEEDTSKKY